MLILIGVTINIAINGGLFGQANEATKEQEKHTIYEQIVDMAIWNEDGTINISETYLAIKNTFGENNVSELGADGIFTVKGKYGEYEYKITTNEISIPGDSKTVNEYKAYGYKNNGIIQPLLFLGPDNSLYMYVDDDGGYMADMLQNGFTLNEYTIQEMLDIFAENNEETAIYQANPSLSIDANSNNKYKILGRENLLAMIYYEPNDEWYEIDASSDNDMTTVSFDTRESHTLYPVTGGIDWYTDQLDPDILFIRSFIMQHGSESYEEVVAAGEEVGIGFEIVPNEYYLITYNGKEYRMYDNGEIKLPQTYTDLYDAVYVYEYQNQPALSIQFLRGGKAIYCLACIPVIVDYTLNGNEATIINNGETIMTISSDYNSITIPDGNKTRKFIRTNRWDYMLKFEFGNYGYVEGKEIYAGAIYKSQSGDYVIVTRFGQFIDDADYKTDQLSVVQEGDPTRIEYKDVIYTLVTSENNV